MQYHTHGAASIVAITTVSYALAATNRPLDVVSLATFSAGTILGGLINDLDSPTSKIRHMLHCAGPPKGPNHRGPLHWPIVWLILIPIIMIIQIPILQAFVFGVFIGAETHLLLDANNPTGIKLFAPLSMKRHRLLRIRTGSLGEQIFFALLVSLELYLVIIMKIPIISGG